MNYRLRPILSAAFLLAASALPHFADANVIVQTVTYDSSDYSGSVVTNGFSTNAIAPLLVTDNFTAFNPALGTLNSVTLELSLTFQIDWTDPNPSASPGINGSVNIVWDQGGPSQHTLWVTGGGNGRGPSASGSLTMSIYTTATDPDNFTFDLASFQAPYTLSLVSDSMTVGGSAGATVDYQLLSGSLAVTYDYTPSAVPEPSTYAALAGLGVLCLAVWRRRR